ncbi:head decoration protein [Amaricoccus solimangrovi]|uniref:Head decoration protein n=1 Tax=Amaricoccus solimangrovi TaxID=2589815 RepID=A0A501WBC3_9RHOB|nr:head decoration protein [Amaricoccus solimangrovi]TPE47233.1 head decoration protein [Amaricoccus solimangrovi]
MATLTEGNYLGDLIRYEADNRYSREEITVASGADLTVGAVLGIVTASGKYALSAPGASDGSETPVAVLVTTAAAASADARAVALVREAKLNRSALIFHSSIDTVGERNAAVTALRAVGIVAD